jgi:hypothetical protein
VEIHSSAFRIRVPAALGLLVCSQAVWSQYVAISPSPSYDGSYTVSHWLPLGCYYEEDPYGFGTHTSCRHLQEYVGGSVTGSWDDYGSTSRDFSGQSSNTYTYWILIEYWTPFGEHGWWYSDPASVQVILTPPAPNMYIYPFGPVNNPSGYVVGWNATDATSCDLDLRWFVAPPYQGAAHQEHSTLPTSYEWVVYKGYHIPPRTDHVQARVTCHGPGGSGPEEWRLEFNEFEP